MATLMVDGKAGVRPFRTRPVKGLRFKALLDIFFISNLIVDGPSGELKWGVFRGQARKQASTPSQSVLCFGWCLLIEMEGIFLSLFLMGCLMMGILRGRCRLRSKKCRSKLGFALLGLVSKCPCRSWEDLVRG